MPSLLGDNLTLGIARTTIIRGLCSYYSALSVVQIVHMYCTIFNYNVSIFVLIIFVLSVIIIGKLVNRYWYVQYTSPARPFNNLYLNYVLDIILITVLFINVSVYKIESSEYLVDSLETNRCDEFVFINWSLKLLAFSIEILIYIYIYINDLRHMVECFPKFYVK